MEIKTKLVWERVRTSAIAVSTLEPLLLTSLGVSLGVSLRASIKVTYYFPIDLYCGVQYLLDIGRIYI